MFDLASTRPDHCESALEREPNSALRYDGDFLSEDFCVIDGEFFFVRCILEVPVHGIVDKFGYGIWSSLSRANFDRYVAGFDDGRYDDMGPWWGWFGNSLSTWPETRDIGCWVHPQPGRQRPVVSIDDPLHELAIAQNEGITQSRLLAIYAVAGHTPQQP